MGIDAENRRRAEASKDAGMLAWNVCFSLMMARASSSCGLLSAAAAAFIHKKTIYGILSSLADELLL